MNNSTPSFELVNNDTETGIKCLYCGLTSYNPTDIEQRFCANCKVWHNDPDEVKLAQVARAHGNEINPDTID